MARLMAYISRIPGKVIVATGFMVAADASRIRRAIQFCTCFIVPILHLSEIDFSVLRRNFIVIYSWSWLLLVELAFEDADLVCQGF